MVWYLLGGVGALGAMVGGSLYQTHHASQAIQEAQERRYQSYKLADELRQSSDDLTRLARTYVVTGDDKWEKQYFEVLDIRNGKAPRPANYERIYWDFRAANETPAGTAEAAVALQAMMKTAGITEAEFAKLKEAQGNSDDLVRTETVAMNMVKDRYDDGKGGFTREAEPDLAKAREMMHDLSYHQYKAKIMKPVDQFLALLDQRTQQEVLSAQQQYSLWMWITLAATAFATMVTGLGMWLARNSVMTVFRKTTEVARQIAQGNLTQHIDTHGQDEAATLARELSAMQSRLREIIAEVRDSSGSIASGSAEIASGNLDLSRRTEAQASSLQQTAASMHQLTSTVKANADTASTAKDLAQQACDAARQGGAVMTEVVSTMEGIAQSSRKIADIISVIDNIALQTNILALNAAVESARAGENGKGFAVVASEVRSLASRSAAAAKEISALINDSVTRVEQGSRFVGTAGHQIDEIVSRVERVSQLIGDISAATQEQHVGIDQVGQAVTQLDQVTQQNAALVEQSAAAAGALQEQSDRLRQIVNVFQVQAMGQGQRSLALT